MANPRVHPSTAVDSASMPISFDSSDKKQRSPDAYVVQIPRDQVLRHPPQENVKRFEALSHRGSSGGCCRRCCCCFLCLIIFFIVALGIAAGVLYLVFRFRAPNYSVTQLAISGINFNSTGPISPVFDVTIRADNPNSRVGIHYLDGSDVNVYFDDLLLSDGVLPVFYQPPRNVTLIETSLTGSNVVLGSAATTALVNYESQGNIPLEVRVRAPVKIRVGSLNTWRITVRVECDVVVNSLTNRAQIISNDCNYRVRLW